ncbi:MAG: hypothetical protein AB1938_13410 [Myxococcota bacterium]
MSAPAALCCAVLAASPAAPTSTPEAAPLPSAGPATQAVHFAWRQEDAVWVAGHSTHRAEAHADGRFTVFPIIDVETGPTGPGVTAQLERLSVGRTTLATGRGSPWRAGPPEGMTRRGELTRQRGAVRERLLNGPDGVEVRWRFEEKPLGRGDVRVRLRLDGSVVARTDEGVHLASGDGFVRVGAATWVTAEGRRVPLETTLDGATLLITVPEAVWTTSAFPAEVDPTFGPERAIGFSMLEGPPTIQDDAAVAFDGVNFLVVWRDFRGGVGSDIYGTRVDTAGQVLDPGGIAIAEGPGGQYQPSVTFGGGQYYVAYSDTRLGGSDISGTRVSPTGQPLDTNVTISSATGLQTVPDVAWDGLNFFVVWEDRRSGSNPDIYGARVSPAGVVLDTGGISISTAAQGQYTPRVASDGAGQTLVVWEDTRNLESDIYASFVTPAGVVQNPNGLRINNSTGGQAEPDVAVNPTNWLVVWQDTRSGAFDIYGARVSLGGALVDTTGFPISAAINSQRSPAVVAGPADTFAVLWDDDRSTLNAPDIFGARVQGATVLDATGVLIDNAASTQVDPLLAFDGAQYFVAWQDARTGNADIWGVRLSSTLGPTPPARLLSGAAPFQQAPAAAAGPTASLVVWQEFVGGDWDVRAARLAHDGTLLDASGFAVGMTAGTQGNPAACWVGSGWLVVWEEGPSASRDVLGLVLPPAGGPTAAPFVVSAGASLEASPACAFDGVNALVVWADSRMMNPDIYAARITPTGMVLDASGIAVASGALAQDTPAVTTLGGNFLVAWVNDTGANARVLAARVSPAGAVLDSPVPLSSFSATQTQVALASNGPRALAAWTDGRSGAGNNDIVATRLDSALTVLDPMGVLFSVAGNQGAPVAVWEPALSSWSLAWQDTSAEPWTLHVGVVPDDGGVASGSSLIRPGTEPAWSLSPGGRGAFASSVFLADAGVKSWRVLLRASGVDTGLDGGTDSGVDAGGADAGPLDSGVDAGGVDGGPDAGGTSDAGAGQDAGSADSGVADSGVDAGAVDAGEMDAGDFGFTTAPTTTATCGVEWTYAVGVSAPATLLIASGPLGASLDATDTLRWTPTEAQLGAQRVSLRAEATDGRVAVQDFEVVVDCETRKLSVGCGCASLDAGMLTLLITLLSAWRRRRPQPYAARGR